MSHSLHLVDAHPRGGQGSSIAHTVDSIGTRCELLWQSAMASTNSAMAAESNASSLPGHNKGILVIILILYKRKINSDGNREHNSKEKVSFASNVDSRNLKCYLVVCF